jgi:hypothetical protein
MKHVVGLPLLVGTWNIMNVTTTGGADKNLIGVMTFSKDGSMKFVLPMTVVYDSSGDKSNTVNGSWGVNGNWLIGFVFLGFSSFFLGIGWAYALKAISVPSWHS